MTDTAITSGIGPAAQPSTMAHEPDPDQPLAVTDDERAELRKIVAETPANESGAKIKEFWAVVHAKRRDAAQGAPEGEDGAPDTPEADGAPDAEKFTPAGDGVLTSQLPADALSTLAERSGDVIDGGILDEIGKAAGPWDRHLAEVHERDGDEAFLAAVEAGEEQVIQQLYGGDEAALANGLKEIEQATRTIGGDKASELIDAINGASMLADPGTHQRFLTLARTINRRTAS